MSKRCCAKTCFNSQVNDKSGKTSYFGVPKYEEYAHKWLTAAGREDLLSKPLIKLVKYFICSDHFEPHCFYPGSKKTILRKQTHPLEIPIPTIFKSNIEKFVPKALLNSPEASSRDETETEASSKLTKMKVLNEKMFIAEEDHLEDTNPDMVDFEMLEEENLVKDEEDAEEEKDVFANVCRLCSKKIETNASIQLVPIFRRKDIVKMLNVILPNVIQQDDGWPQDICDLCIEKVKLCDSLINSFVNAQENFLHMS
ncbi:uncharacterized protein LOC132258696 [Phlebotomus argentipes]|uniref:uncharacterized protein LOC132258696 n=1 Tax=Phlebotomus argentipes TaxID=94469 RepID=UPI002892BC06|nr:uncharacterized protein LOC132258696 [Phlebotomus argentipes]